jgi:hypothetical protein
MKNIAWLTFALVFATAEMHAQDYNKYRFGFKVEPNMSWFGPKQNYLEASDNKLRFSFGLNADFHFTENYAIGTGMNVFTTGGELTYLKLHFEDSKDHIVRTVRDYSLKFVEIPLTLKLRTNEIGYITYWGQFGLGLGVKFDAKVDESFSYEYVQEDQGWVESVGKEDVTTENVNISGDIQPIRTSLIIGAGIEYSFSGSTALMAGIVFNNGFTNVLRRKGVQTKSNGEPVFDSGTPIEYDLNAITNSLALTVGILF